MVINVPTPDRDYKVLVRCATYNQSKYICNALNGFAIQETDFPFICMVVDDASKDGNQDVIKQYANDNCDMSKSEVSEDDISVYIRVPHKTNTNCVFLFCLLKVNLYCKPEKQEIYKPYRVVCEYEAICEGDDYWICSLKLKKQFELMENNMDCSLCFSNAMQHYEESDIPDSLFSNVENREYFGYEIIKEWIIPTASSFYRSKIYQSNIYREANKHKKIIYGDIKLFLSCSHEGRIIGMSDIMVVYRRVRTGMVRTMHMSLDTQVKLCYHVKELSVVFGKEYKQITDSIFSERCLLGVFHSLKNLNLRFFFKFFIMLFSVSPFITINELFHIIRKK